MKLKHLLEGQFDEPNDDDPEKTKKKFRKALNQKLKILTALYSSKTSSGREVKLFNEIRRKGFTFYGGGDIPPGYTVKQEARAIEAYMFRDTPENWELINKAHKVVEQRYRLYDKMGVIKNLLDDMR